MTKANQEYQAEILKGKTISKQGVLDVIASARAMMTAGSETKAYAYELGKYKEIQEKVANGKGIDADALTKMMAEAKDPATKLQSSIEEANEASNKFANDATANNAKIAGANGVLFDTINSIGNGLEDVAKQQRIMGDTGKNKGVTAEMKKQAEMLTKVLGLMIGLNTAGAFKKAAEAIAKNNVLMATGARESKNIADQAKRLSKFSSKNEAIEQIRLDLVRDSAVKMKEALDAELKKKLKEKMQK